MTSLDQPHRRYNPLLDEWLIVAPQRGNRPWQGQKEKKTEEKIEKFDPKNPLCPGVTRPNGQTNPEYESTYVFINDFPSFLPELPELDSTRSSKENEQDPLFQSRNEKGTCRVMCFHPRSDLQLGTMTHQDRRKVVNEWCKQLTELGAIYEWVQIFENKGAIMGCSNPHPHCQIWATSFLPNQIQTKHRTQKEFYAKYGKPMLMDYANKELEKKERIVAETEHWIILVPYWAVWPYETMILPKRHVSRMVDLTEAEKDDLCEAMRTILVKYDNLFECTFPYSMGWHGAPTGGFYQEDCSHWQLHGTYLPPLFRSAAVKKFMAGYEMVCEPQRDLTAEKAAKILADLSTVHYRSETD